MTHSRFKMPVVAVLLAFFGCCACGNTDDVGESGGAFRDDGDANKADDLGAGDTPNFGSCDISSVEQKKQDCLTKCEGNKISKEQEQQQCPVLCKQTIDEARCAHSCVLFSTLSCEQVCAQQWNSDSVAEMLTRIGQPDCVEHCNKNKPSQCSADCDAADQFCLKGCEELQNTDCQTECRLSSNGAATATGDIAKALPGAMPAPLPLPSPEIWTSGVPVDCTTRKMTAYSDGRPYTIDVITIAGKPIAKATGHAYLKWLAAARRRGVSLELNSAFRTYDQQAYFYNCFVTRRCNNGNPADPPGYSKHQDGRSIDIWPSDGNWSWIQSSERTFGFQGIASEVWHKNYVCDVNGDPGGPCSSGGSSSGSSGLICGDTAPNVASGFIWHGAKDGGWYKNVSQGITLRVSTANDVQNVHFVADCKYDMGNALKDPVSNTFAIHYKFQKSGWRTIQAIGYKNGLKVLKSKPIAIKVVD